MKRLVEFSIHRPKEVIAGIVVLTIVFMTVIFFKFSINVDPNKSFTKELDVVRYYHMTLKKFSMKDTILIGIENTEDTVFNVETIRYIEKVMKRIEELKIKKSYDNIFTGKKETRELQTHLSSSEMMSIINAQDVMVDKASNTIVVGNLTSRARILSGMSSADEDEMKKLPSDDEELKKILVPLRNELNKNELFKGTLISQDERACAITVPIESRLANKVEVIRRELFIMTDADKLKNRFQGGEFYFPYNVYNKKVDGVLVNDAYIRSHVEKNKGRVKDCFLSLFKELKEHRKDFYQNLKKAPVTEEYITSALKMMETDQIYDIPGIDLAYPDAIDTLYEFVIKNLDPLSKNNLESKLYTVKDVYDVGLISDTLKTLTDKDKPANLKVYIAGRPVAEALLERMVVNDMSFFMVFSVLVIMFILYLSFRSWVGIFLPLASVTVCIIWCIGVQLLIGIPVSSGTITIPCILMAVGSSYMIHYITRYYEKAIDEGIRDSREALLSTTSHIKMAIILSAATTMAAFISNLTSSIIDIRMMSLLTAIGVFISMVLTFTLGPAVLAILPVPRSIKSTPAEEVAMKLTMKVGEYTNNNAKRVFIFSMIVFVLFSWGVVFLKTESSISFMFTEDNPIRVSERFINKKLTGTGQTSIIFKMRDHVSLVSPETQKELGRRIDGFLDSYKGLKGRHPELGASEGMNEFIEELGLLKETPVKNQARIESIVGVLNNALDEYYEIDKSKIPPAAVANKKSEAAVDDMDAAADVRTSSDGEGSSALTPADEGIKEIVSRIDTLTSDPEKEKAASFIRSIRKVRYNDADKEFVGRFNELNDFFLTDIRQPATLRKLDILGRRLKDLKEPKAVIEGQKVNPVGSILSITDSLKLIYKVFYHEGNEKFEKIPEIAKDGITGDKTLTDRSVISVCMSQLKSSREEFFKYLTTDDQKMMQYVVFTRSDMADFLKDFEKNFYAISKEIFPDHDPYVEKIVISGLPAINMEMNHQLAIQQAKSLVFTQIVVLICCILIFRSVIGGLFSIVPITITVILNLGIMGWLGLPINYSTVIVASIAVGAGIDYSIHFLERFKLEHIEKQLGFMDAYYNTLKTTGKGIVTATASVAGGFAVLGVSNFMMIKISGVMIAIAMFMSGTASLTLLPALIIWLKPKFLAKTESGDMFGFLRRFNKIQN